MDAQADPIETIQRLLHEKETIKDQQVAAKLGDYAITHKKSASIAWLSVSILFITLLVVIVRCTRSLIGTSELVLQTVADGFHGEGTYIELKRASKSRNSIANLPTKIVVKRQKRPVSTS